MNSNVREKLMDREYILCSAIWYKDIPVMKKFDCNVLPLNCDKGLVFCGHRHTQCQYTMISVTGIRSVESEIGEYEQGFLTSKNRFVDRIEGLKIAQEANQIKSEYKLTQLHSEDLW